MSVTHRCSSCGEPWTPGALHVCQVSLNQAAANFLGIPHRPRPVATLEPEVESLRTELATLKDRLDKLERAVYGKREV